MRTPPALLLTLAFSPFREVCTFLRNDALGRIYDAIIGQRSPGFDAGFNGHHTGGAQGR